MGGRKVRTQSRESTLFGTAASEESPAPNSDRRRAEQNRKNQRAYRQRKDLLIESLQSRVAELEKGMGIQREQATGEGEEEKSIAGMDYDQLNDTPLSDSQSIAIVSDPSSIEAQLEALKKENQLLKSQITDLVQKQFEALAETHRAMTSKPCSCSCSCSSASCADLSVVSGQTVLPPLTPLVTKKGGVSLPSIPSIVREGSLSSNTTTTASNSSILSGSHFVRNPFGVTNHHEQQFQNQHQYNTDIESPHSLDPALYRCFKLDNGLKSILSLRGEANLIQQVCSLSLQQPQTANGSDHSSNMASSNPESSLAGAYLMKFLALKYVLFAKCQSSDDHYSLVELLDETRLEYNSAMNASFEAMMPMDEIKQFCLNAVIHTESSELFVAALKNVSSLSAVGAGFLVDELRALYQAQEKAVSGSREKFLFVVGMIKTKHAILNLCTAEDRKRSLVIIESCRSHSEYVRTMDDKSAKQRLKQAKEQLDSKQYKAAVELCAGVFDSDGAVSAGLRYNALLMGGLATKTGGDSKNARVYYERAARLMPDMVQAYNALAALAESENDTDALVEALKSLTYVLKSATPIDAKKCVAAFQKLALLLETEVEDYGAASEVLADLLTLTDSNPDCKQEVALESSTNGLDPIVLILSRIIKLIEMEEAEFMEREVELRRRRLGAADLATTKRNVEAELVSKSKVHLYYERLLSIQDDASEDTQLTKGKLALFLLKKLRHTLPEEKGPILHRIRDLVSDFLEKSSQIESGFSADSVILIEHVINTQDCDIDSYPLDMIRTAYVRFQNTAIGLACAGYLNWKEPTDEGDSIEDATDKILTSIEIDATSIFANHTLAKLYFELQDYESSAVVSKRALELVRAWNLESGENLKTTVLSLEMILAEAYCAIGPKYHQNAVKLFSSVLDSDPSSIRAHRGISQSYFDVQNYSASLKHLSLIVADLDPTNDMALSDIAWNHFHTHQYDEALAWIKKAVGFCDCALHNYRHGKILWAFGGDSRSAAYSYFLKAAKQDPSTRGVFTAIGMFCLEVDENSPRAMKCFQKALQVDAADEEAAVHLSQLYLEEQPDQDDEQKLKNVETAKIVLTEFIAVVPRSATAWRYLGFIALRQNEFTEAITSFQTSLRLDTKSITSWEGLGEAYSEEGKYMASLKAFARAYELDPTSIYSLYQSAHVNMKLGLYKEAIADFERVLDSVVQTDSTVENDHDLDVIPCLESLAECNLLSARDAYYSQGSYGRCIQHLNSALDACCQILEKSKKAGVVAVQGVYKTLGDVCVSVHTFRSRHVGTLLDVALIERGLEIFGVKSAKGENQNSYMLALSLAVESFRTAIAACQAAVNMQPELKSLIPLHLHDMALAQYYRHELSLHQQEGGGSEGADRYLKQALMCMWKALHADPTNEHLWNSLGIMALRGNSKIAQHAFIKALELNERAVEPWTNLGYFYYFNHDMDLAKQCFGRAQLLDPESSLCWYGQGLINESRVLSDISTGPDLFDHANNLAQGQNAEVGFSYALSEYQRNASALFSSDVEESDALASPVFSMLKFCEIWDNDAKGWNLLGLLRERQGMYDEAASAFKKAVELDDSADYLVNYARCLCSAGAYNDAIDTYNLLFSQSEGDVLSRVGFGLALFFERRLEESLGAFQSALDLLGELGDSQILLQNKVGLMLSQVLYALGTDAHISLARDQLLECIGRPNGFPQALISLLALGIVCQNDVLASSAAAELMKEKPDALVGLEFDKNIILSRFFLLQGNVKLSRGFLARSVHQSPWKSVHWQSLADNIARHSPEITNSLVAVAKSAFLLQNPHGKSDILTVSEKAAIHQSLGLALLTRQPQQQKVVDESREVKAATARFYLHSGIRSNPSNAQSWFALGIGARQEISKNLAEEQFTAAHLHIKTVETISQCCSVVSEPESLVGTWSRLLSSDAQVVRGALLLRDEPTNADSIQIVNGALELSESARSNADVVDKRVMAMGYAVGARALLALGNHATAFSAYRNAVAINPDPNQNLEELAEAYTSVNRFSQAVLCLMQALCFCSSESMRSVILSRLAQIHFMTGNNSEASEALDQLKQTSLDGTFNGNSRFLECISLVRVGNAGAIAKCKKMVIALEDEGCKWVSWVKDQLDAR
ncbi:Superkiller protein 3 [Chytriomyces hyalinus]|nr:Superkiller protein 3 [Chytriomyces hyalinus]